MKTADGLVKPRLSLSRFLYGKQSNQFDTVACEELVYYTDEELFNQTGVRIAFTTRHGGVSQQGYESLNLATHVADSYERVLQNRYRLMCALHASELPLVVPHQVHKTHVACLSATSSLNAFIREAQQGSDGLIVERSGVAALLNFADCIPVIVVTERGTFAVIHAGWRGVIDHIVPKAIHILINSSQVSVDQCNVYIGAHIRSECFEVSPEIAQRFADAFGDIVIEGSRNVSLEAALCQDLAAIGVPNARIATLGMCTVCNNDQFYSYRAQQGVCGRHAACAVRIEGKTI